MMKYRFYCKTCKREVKRKEVMPLVISHQVTPKGSPREVIERAYHLNCAKSLNITIFESDGNKQNKLFPVLETIGDEK